jgi:O-methyltransferase
MNLFTIAASLLILLVLVLLARYAWGIFFDSSYRPVEWDHARNQGMVSIELAALEKNYPDKVRFFNWWFQIERLKRDSIPGDFAELGVYKGESARIIHRMDPSRKFHLFDTFEGFRDEDLEEETGEAATYTTRSFADTSLEAARRFIDGNENVIFHPGNFCQFAVPSSQFAVHNLADYQLHSTRNRELGTANGERGTANGELTFAFVNLDADLYNPTKAGLEYFYPRLSPGGVIIIHDYTYKWPGIRKAVDEFAARIPESLVAVPDMDGSVMIVKNAN